MCAAAGEESSSPAAAFCPEGRSCGQRKAAALQGVQNVLTYMRAESKIITKRLSVYTDDLDSIF